MNAVIILADYFRPRRFCIVCGTNDARTACGSSYCTSCWENINDAILVEEPCSVSNSLGQ